MGEIAIGLDIQCVEYDIIYWGGGGLMQLILNKDCAIWGDADVG